MTHDRKKSDSDYKDRLKAKGYVRIHKWIPAQFKSTIYPIIDLLACHQEDPASTVEFHDFLLSIMKVSKQITEEYGVNDDGK